MVAELISTSVNFKHQNVLSSCSVISHLSKANMSLEKGHFKEETMLHTKILWTGLSAAIEICFREDCWAVVY